MVIYLNFVVHYYYSMMKPRDCNLNLPRVNPDFTLKPRRRLLVLPSTCTFSRRSPQKHLKAIIRLTQVGIQLVGRWVGCICLASKEVGVVPVQCTLSETEAAVFNTGRVGNVSVREAHTSSGRARSLDKNWRGFVSWIMAMNG